MKKFLGIMVGLLLSCSVYPVYADTAANDLPKLKIKIVNTLKNQNFALCLSENCYALTATDQEISLEEGTIDSIVMANMDNMQMYAQDLPRSCKLNIKGNQVLTVTGKVESRNAHVFVNDLNCSVSTSA